MQDLYNNERSLFDKIQEFFSKLLETFDELVQSGSWRQDATLAKDVESVRKIAAVFDAVARTLDNEALGEEAKLSRLDPGAMATIDTEANIDAVARMEQVDSLRGDEFKMGKKGELIKAVTDYFASLGNNVENAEIGTVWFDKAGVKSDIGHGLGADKAASFKAVPAVLEKGKVVDIQYNWKQRGYDTVLIAAPVDIHNERYYMGIVVTKSSDSDRFYAHEVWGIKKEGASAFWTGLPADSQVGTGASAPSVNSILRRIADVNPAGSETVKFSAKDPVERKGTLLAIHNLTSEKLEKFLALGGAPMPSIAVTRSDVEHSNFGDISLVFDKSTIDPKADKRNVVYSADAWTPTFPNTEYEVNKQVDSAASSKLYKLKQGMDEYYANELTMVLGDTEYTLNREGGEQGFIDYAERNLGMKAAYLESI